MKKTLLALLFFTIAFIFQTAQPAVARPPMWCAQSESGAPQCIFFSLRECFAATDETAFACEVMRGEYLVVAPVAKYSVFLFGGETFRPLCSQAEDSSTECTFFTLTQCLETMQRFSDCSVKQDTYLVVAPPGMAVRLVVE
jgi:hypothetical protein